MRITLSIYGEYVTRIRDSLLGEKEIQLFNNVLISGSLVSDGLQDDIEKAGILPAIKTDHWAISLSVKSLKDQQFGPSYCKFNSSLLDDDTYIQRINSEYPKWITEFTEVNDKRLLWDLIKYNCSIQQR